MWSLHWVSESGAGRPRKNNSNTKNTALTRGVFTFYIVAQYTHVSRCCEGDSRDVGCRCVIFLSLNAILVPGAYSGLDDGFFRTVGMLAPLIGGSVGDGRTHCSLVEYHARTETLSFCGTRANAFNRVYEHVRMAWRATVSLGDVSGKRVLYRATGNHSFGAGVYSVVN